MTDTNPKKSPDVRRKRPSYPEIAIGEAVRVDRPECGRNVPMRLTNLDGTPPPARPVLYDCFVFRRGISHRDRSKYMPHRENKEVAP